MGSNPLTEAPSVVEHALGSPPGLHRLSKGGSVKLPLPSREAQVSGATVGEPTMVQQHVSDSVYVKMVDVL